MSGKLKMKNTHTYLRLGHEQHFCLGSEFNSETIIP